MRLNTNEQLELNAICECEYWEFGNQCPLFEWFNGLVGWCSIQIQCQNEQTFLFVLHRVSGAFATRANRCMFMNRLIRYLAQVMSVDIDTCITWNINANPIIWIYLTDGARAGRWWKMINDCIWVRECVWSIHFRHANYIQSKSPFFFFSFFVAEEKRKVKMTTADTDASRLFVADKCRFSRRT